MLIGDCDGDCRNCDDKGCPEHYSQDLMDDFPEHEPDAEDMLRELEYDSFYRLMKYGYD